MMNLRGSLPVFDTPPLHSEWLRALGTIASLNDLDVPCAMQIGTRRILFQCLRAMRARSVLDVGTYLGSSALTFALAVGAGGRVVSVDTNPVNSDAGYWRSAAIGRALSPSEMMREAGVSDRVEFVTSDARYFLGHTRETFDLICLDGWHEHFAVEREIELSLRRLNPGGLIFLDDVQDPADPPPPGLDTIDGPRIAIDALVGAGFPIVPLRISRGLSGEWAAIAFLLSSEAMR